MTLEFLAYRLGAALALCGFGVWAAAVVCWMSVGDAAPVVHSIHMLAGWLLAIFGTVLIVLGFTLASGVPAKTRPEEASDALGDGIS